MIILDVIAVVLLIVSFWSVIGVVYFIAEKILDLPKGIQNDERLINCPDPDVCLYVHCGCYARRFEESQALSRAKREGTIPATEELPHSETRDSCSRH